MTWRSCIASSSAACVFGGVRLISSASSTFVNTGPRRKIELAAAQRRSLPVTSDGSMSGVNWMRRKSSPSARDRADASSVFATPGTPSSSTCPPSETAASAVAVICSWPTTTFSTSPVTASYKSRTRASYAAPPVRRASARPAAMPSSSVSS